MDYLDGVKDFDEFLIENFDKLDADIVITYIKDVVDGLCYLHENKIIHCDIKPANIIISPQSPALVADLGYAKNLEKLPKDTTTSVTHTPDFAHPDLIDQMEKSTDPNASISKIKREKLREAFDLYALGRTLQKVLQKIQNKEKEENKQKSIFSQYQWQYLALIAVRLLDGQVKNVNRNPLESDTTLGLPISEMDLIKYKSVDEAQEDLEKLLNFYDLEEEIPELNFNFSPYIQLPKSTIPLSERVSKIINHPCFIRLAQVTQLGFVSLVYPGARHTRFEHSLGTFDKCRKIVLSLWYDKINCLFRSIMLKSDIEGVLLAALLHDIGQYPMGHDLYEVHNDFSPDRFTETLIKGLVPNINLSIADIIAKEWAIDPDVVISILNANKKSGLKHRLLHSIISGPLDIDKLDYLERDPLHIGVFFGKDIDQDRLLRNLTVCLRVRDINEERIIDVCEIGVAEKALAVAESIWRARKDMFRQVYWHHTMRSLKAMLMFVVRRIMIKLDKNNDKHDFSVELYNFCLAPLNYIQNLHNCNLGKYNHSGNFNFDIMESLA